LKLILKTTISLTKLGFTIHERFLYEKKDPIFTVSDIQKVAEELGLDFRNRPDLYKQLELLEEYEYLEKNQKSKHATSYYNICFEYERDEKGEISNLDSPDIKVILTPDQLRERIEGEAKEMVPESVCRNAPELSRAEE